MKLSQFFQLLIATRKNAKMGTLLFYNVPSPVGEGTLRFYNVPVFRKRERCKNDTFPHRSVGERCKNATFPFLVKFTIFVYTRVNTICKA